MMANRNLSFISLNIQGLRNATYRRTLFSWLNCVKRNVVALRETHPVFDEELLGINLQGYAVA